MLHLQAARVSKVKFTIQERKRDSMIIPLHFINLNLKYLPSSIQNLYNILSEFYFRDFSNKTKDCVSTLSTLAYWGVNFALRSCN